MSKGKVIVVLSGCQSIALQKKDGRKIDQETGFFMKELAQPLIQIIEAGYTPVIATPEAQKPQMDPMSNSSIWFLGNWAEKNRELNFVQSLDKELQNPRALASFSDDELGSFAGILIPGGHSPMGDLGSDKALGHILNYFHKARKPTGVICHGPIALLSTTLENGEFAYKGYKVTCYANKEEASNEMMWGAKLETKVEDALRNAGAEVEVATVPLMPNVLRDRELVSGEGPSSAWKFGQEYVKLLEEHAK
ncbi:hypothetical protein M422DRAFT_782730 [Sphaerobolus stellatus SS14]|uniref:D-lactate dehydratase n=1 Tax=Sphaerobolus stellatus (strain SS14) TaxID=990650 RepID=A0A0C9UIY5_SPHS4|nr:hypothetical protein M422DRAFT_782730 [Sphaerobolus stellatus SS14]